MTSNALKLVALMLLIAQAAIFASPGRMICIQTRACETHGHGAKVACEHHAVGQVSGVEGAPVGVWLDPVSAAFHPASDCGCHAHIPVPGDGQAPINPWGGGPEPRTVGIPPVPVLVDFGRIPPRVETTRGRPPDHGEPEHLRALKTTRLLI
ncbi:MAG: hypothetical protein HRU70_11715 [Phycisphaeraceae bacterium]|nr:MAG: hypothetical protein HRU70_11715 [Phycisphaeraceae bacterium]